MTLALGRRCCAPRILSLVCIVGCHVLATIAVVARARPAKPPQLPHEDAVVIAETYHLWQSLGDKVWAGWTQIEMPIIYVTDDYEYAVGCRRTLSGFTPLERN